MRRGITPGNKLVLAGMAVGIGTRKLGGRGINTGVPVLNNILKQLKHLCHASSHAPTNPATTNPAKSRRGPVPRGRGPLRSHPRGVFGLVFCGLGVAGLEFSGVSLGLIGIKLVW
jgi:hypothetical protein